MTMSKIYGVKSNAARAAAAYKLTRADLVPVSGGWCFPIPETTQLGQQLIAAMNEGIEMVRDGTAFVASQSEAEALAVEPDANEPDVPDARAAHTVVNGRPTSDPLPPSPWGDDQPPVNMNQVHVGTSVTFPHDPSMAVVAAKPPSQRRAKATDKPKVAKRTKASLPVVDGPTKRGTKAYDDKMAARRRAGMNKRGITELVIKEIRTRWTPTSELLKMTGWQPTTLRGVLSLYAKANNIEIRGETRDGERYYLVAR